MNKDLMWQEKWCPVCDKSSRDTNGEFVFNSWYCDEHIVEVKVTTEQVNKHFAKLLKDLE